MKNAAIIAEYNPFHKGHAYLISEARRITGADRIIVIMSGDFVQRGEPAITDKYTRAQMALTCGADFVLELPVMGATASAEFFASSAVSILHHLGCVDYLCFGCEDPDLTPLKAIASLYNDEPEAFKASLKNALSQGLSFPAARAQAAISYLTKEKQTSFNPELLKMPNNILAIEYIRGLLKLKSSIQPVAIKRLSNDYHSIDIKGDLISAKAIRNLLTDFSSGKEVTGIPENCCKTFMDSISLYGTMTSRLLTPYLGLKLLDNQQTLTTYMDINEDLSNRILSMAADYTDYETFHDRLISKNMTGTRISRALLHLLLNIKEEDMQKWKNASYKGYVRVLGFTDLGASLFKDLRKDSDLVLMTNPAKDRDRLSPLGKMIYEQDLYTESLYRQIRMIHSGQRMPMPLSRPLIKL